jgi:hypothetical protein
MVNTTGIADVVVLVRVPLIEPEPLLAIPVAVTVLSLVQLYTAPATLPETDIVVIGVPLHSV